MTLAVRRKQARSPSERGVQPQGMGATGGVNPAFDPELAQRRRSVSAGTPQRGRTYGEAGYTRGVSRL
jgi:hypothetical protein